MKINQLLVWLWVSTFVLVNTQRLCNDCYGEKNGKIKFTCSQQKCDSFLWPRDSPLPANLQCKYDSSNHPEASCYVLNGLDPTSKYHKFISLNRFTKKASKSRQSIKDALTFTFDQEQQKLTITADFTGSKYQGQLLSHPDINFSDVQQALSNGQFKILTRGGESIRLKVGFYTMQLKNKLLISINELRDNLQELEDKLDQMDGREQDKGLAKMGDRVKKLQTQNEELESEIVKLNKKLNDLSVSSSTLKTQAESANKQATQANTKLAQVQKANNDLKTRLTAAQKKLQECSKFVIDYEKNSTSTQNRVAAVQQRVTNNDMTINQLRQMFSTVDRRFAQVEKIFKTQKNVTSQFHEILIKQFSRNLKIPEFTLLGSMIQAIDVEVGESVASQPIVIEGNQINTTKNGTSSGIVLSIKEYPFGQLSNYSKVVTSHEELETIGKFFAPKKILKIELLYRASQNEFSAAIFHKLCDKIPDTLVLFQTQFNKKIGGFTPLLWDGTKNGQYRGDLTGQSFIFSLTNKDKFTLQQKDKAIWNHINYGPIFGSGADLSICDEANEKALSYTDISKSYLNPNYKQRDRDSLERFCGNVNNSWHFKVKEWQVWRVEFEAGKEEVGQVTA